MDQVRYILADDDETLRPPEIRQRLMRLHRLASKLLNEVGKKQPTPGAFAGLTVDCLMRNRKNFSISEKRLRLKFSRCKTLGLSNEVYRNHLDKIYDALRPLEELYPDDEEEYWEEEGA